MTWEKLTISRCPKSILDMPELIKVEQKGRVGLITLDRPRQLNALSPQLMQELGKALLDFDADAGVGGIVITGSEKAFAAGADIAAMKDFGYMDAFMGDYVTAWEHWRKVRKPVIAAVAGYALGGGNELAMQCDIIIAADNARFGQPEINLGIMPGFGGTQRLPRFTGKAKAMDLCLAGGKIGREHAWSPVTATSSTLALPWKKTEKHTSELQSRL